MLIAVLTPSLQPGLESCFAGLAVPLFCWQQELSSGPSLAVGETRQQLHPQPFCNLMKSLTIVSLAMLKGARPPELALVWRVGAALLGGVGGRAAVGSRSPALRHDGRCLRVGRLEGGEARCCSS